MIYYKRKDNSVIGKLDSIPKEQKKAYLDAGCVECDQDGVVKSAPKKKAKK
tara:strand:+ start:107 stop:259 length:153 start_codon:yes stop_codon:yes gene_type:complete